MDVFRLHKDFKNVQIISEMETMVTVIVKVNKSHPLVLIKYLTKYNTILHVGLLLGRPIVKLVLPMSDSSNNN